MHRQAAEKAVKALLVHRRVKFPYVHDCLRLLGLLEDAGEAVPDEIRQAGRLNRYAVATRYPLMGDQVTQEDYERAVAIAEAVVHWAEERLAASGGSA